MVEYYLFGGVEARVDGAPAALGGPKQRCALAVLLAGHGTVVSADRLIDAIWPADPPAKALVSVRSYVANLRRCLADASPAAAVRLTSRSPGYRLELLDGDRVDLLRFEELVKNGRAALAGDDAYAAFDLLTDALALWRGTPFGAFADREFARNDVLRCESLLHEATVARFDAGLRRGDSTALIPEIEVALGGQPLQERLWGQLMLALYRAGRTGDALRAYERAAAALDREIGARPGADLQGLHLQILEHDAELGTPVPARLPATGSAAVPPTVIGRAAELDTAAAMVARARAGAGSLLVITGDSGIGKTSLTAVVADRAEPAGLTVAWATHSSGIRVPRLWTWIQILRRLGRELGAPGRERVRRAAPGVVEALVPEWHTADAVGANVVAASGFQLVQGVVDAVVELAAVRPLLLVLDDLHLADTMSAQVLGLLSGALPLLPVQVVANWTLFGADRPVNRQEFDRLVRSGGTTTIRLRGIDAGAVARLAADLSGAAVNPAIVDYLWAHAGGNPFFVRELVRAFDVDGRLQGTDVPGLDAVPDAIAGVVGSRLEALDGPSRRTLAAAAVLGPEFEVPELASILGEPSTIARERLRPAYETGLLDRHPGRPGSYRFSHGLVRDAVLAQISGTDRTTIHAAVAAAAADTLDTAPYEDTIAAAGHAWNAGTELDPAVALRIHEAVIARALTRSAYADVVVLVEHAVQICRRLPAEPELLEREATLWLHLAGSRGILHGQVSAAAAAAVDRAFELGGQAKGREFYGAMAMQAMMLCGRGRLDEAELICAGLADRYAACGDPDVGVAGHFVQIMIHALRGRSEAMFDVARAMLATFPAPETVADPMHFFHPRVYCWMGLMAALRGDRVAAQENLRIAMELAHSRGDVFNLLAARLSMVEADAVLGICAGTGPAADSVAAALAAAGAQQWAACAEVVAVWAHTLCGAGVDPAAAYAAYEAITEDGSTVMTAFFLALLADIEAYHGRPEQAHELLSRARVLADLTGEHAWDDLLAERAARLPQPHGAPVRTPVPDGS
ncbi:AfsR/SARP family transcriptional regulator [Nocardia stercoris]|uniref:Transcriptional regulator n=1 Tax=Nocardia stercoris TaxID=2483361 RepID=A0A3M2LB93_9NOCA|nr:AfsR/SARP family transcriptional regulator [Nocardia stercoris]RMI34829.1 transcriptional regulator [Nocardia stercoris]